MRIDAPRPSPGFLGLQRIKKGSNFFLKQNLNDSWFSKSYYIQINLLNAKFAII